LSSFAISEKEITYKSNNSKVASIDSDGLVKAKKPGQATITAKAGPASAKCRITVKKPTVKLSESEITLYRNATKKLKVTTNCTTSEVTFKSSKKRVATVDEKGRITAVSHGLAIITASIGGESASCIVNVMQPEVTLSTNEIRLKKGETFKLSAFVSSGNTPEWSSSNSAIATVSSGGTVKAKSKGKTFIYAKEDGIKARCKITVE
ncbi:MAG: Ig-like domain-containing protein, partial [Lachnospiraceae bacterium]|nr:Ig-like domain-containing protein [Lachnospiraceae bacterium]